MGDYSEIRKALELMREDFNERIDAIECRLSEGEIRIAVHDTKFVTLEDSVREIKLTSHKTQAELGRLADALTGTRRAWR